MIPPAAWIIFTPSAVFLLGAGLVFLVKRRKHRRHVPGLPYDGWPLSVPERERLEEIEKGYTKTAIEPGRRM